MFICRLVKTGGNLKTNSEPILQEYVTVVKWNDKLHEQLGDLYLNSTSGGQRMLETLRITGTNRGALMIRARNLFGERPSDEIRQAREQGSAEKVGLPFIREMLARESRTPSPPVPEKQKHEEVVAEPPRRAVVADRLMPHRKFAESELRQDQSGWVSSNKQPSVFKAPNGACQWWLRNAETKREKPCGTETEGIFCDGHEKEATEYVEARRNFNPASDDMFGTRRRQR